MQTRLKNLKNKKDSQQKQVRKITIADFGTAQGSVWMEEVRKMEERKQRMANSQRGYYPTSQIQKIPDYRSKSPVLNQRRNVRMPMQPVLNNQNPNSIPYYDNTAFAKKYEGLNTDLNCVSKTSRTRRSRKDRIQNRNMNSKIGSTSNLSSCHQVSDQLLKPVRSNTPIPSQHPSAYNQTFGKKDTKSEDSDRQKNIFQMPKNLVLVPNIPSNPKSKAFAPVQTPRKRIPRYAQALNSLYDDKKSPIWARYEQQIAKSQVREASTQTQEIYDAQIAQRDTLDILISHVRKINPHVKIHDYKNNFEDLDVNFLDMNQLKIELGQLEEKGINFHKELILMRPSLRYAVLALLSANKFNIFNQGLIDFMKSLNNGNWNNQEQTANYGAYIIDYINQFEDLDYKHDSNDQIDEIFRLLMKKEKLLEDFKKSYQSNENFICQRRVLVTPTLFQFTVAKAEEGNKVLRQYRSCLSQFIRLTFVTDFMEKGFYSSLFDSSWSILGYIHSILKNGFYAGRNMKNCFLSYSNSQLKNHTCWFLAQIFEGATEESIIKSMGEFEHEKNILKKYARRGQCFSTTKKIQDLEESLVCQDYPDIERNGYCFSDGCGLIHPDLAEKIAHKFGHTQVSAFQIRIGGAKGVLATVSDDYTEMFRNEQPGAEQLVLLRKSQVKFPSNNLSLEIIRCSTYSQGYLNRQLIILLHNLGVPIKYFLKNSVKPSNI